ncbi:MAG: ATP-binding protein, partial [Ilumatobacteraceae bacterium]
FEGFVIISTNLAGNVDQAFQRRLQAMIEFPTPDRTARLALWNLHLPMAATNGEVSHDELADIPMSGGNVRNIAVAAVFLAAAEGEVVGREHLRIALRRELRKLGRLAEDLLN